MRGQKRRLRDHIDEDEKFETEAFAYLNEENENEDKKKKTQHGNLSDSDPEFSEDSDSDAAEDDIVVGVDNEENNYEEEEEKHDDDDDDAPDDIGFSDSRKTIMTQLRSAMEQIDADKRKKKEQRKKLDAQFKEQRALKKEKLSKAKLPEDFFDDLEEAVPKKQNIKTVEKSKKLKETFEETKTEEDTEAEVERNILQDDFISLSDSEPRVTIATVKDIEKRKKSVKQAALDFRQRRLYGANIPRESNNQRLATAEKRRYVKKS